MSGFTSFMDAVEQDKAERGSEKRKRSVPAPKGDHRLSVNLSEETMGMINELVFLRRQRTYRAIIESLIADEYEALTKGDE